jgi:hypothetical protein
LTLLNGDKTFILDIWATGPTTFATRMQKEYGANLYKKTELNIRKTDYQGLD